MCRLHQLVLPVHSSIALFCAIPGAEKSPKLLSRKIFCALAGRWSPKSRQNIPRRAIPQRPLLARQLSANLAELQRLNDFRLEK